MGKKVVMIIAPSNFRDEEYLQPREILESKGAEVKVASKGVTRARGMLGHEANVDLQLNQVNVDEYDAVVFVGGSGASVYFDDALAQKIAKDAVAKNKILGAICVAPSILANAGLLEGVEATCFESEKENLEKHGAKYIKTGVVEVGNMVTSSGPEAAKQFGNKLAEKLGL